jgi:hypothetical protein
MEVVDDPAARVDGEACGRLVYGNLELKDFNPETTRGLLLADESGQAPPAALRGDIRRN